MVAAFQRKLQRLYIYYSRRFVAVMSPSYFSSRLTKFEYILSLTQIAEAGASWHSLLPVLYIPCNIPPALKYFKCNTINYATMRGSYYPQMPPNKAQAEIDVDEQFKIALIKRLGEPMNVACTCQQVADAIP